MALFLAFLLGVANFAAQRAVLDSRHPLFAAMPAPTARIARHASLGLEFAVLLAALYVVGEGQTLGLWCYIGYSLVNGVAAWLIASRRV